MPSEMTDVLQPSKCATGLNWSCIKVPHKTQSEQSVLFFGRFPSSIRRI